MEDVQLIAVVGQVRLYARCYQIQHDSMEDFKGMSTTELARACAVSVPTASKYLKELESVGLVECVPTEWRSNATRYGWILSEYGEEFFRKHRARVGYNRALDWIISNHKAKAEREARKITSGMWGMF